jgi:hypothetical protein
MSSEKNKNETNEVVEELTLKGSEVVEYIKNLVRKGNVRTLIVRKSNGDEIMSLPLTAGVVGAAAVVVIAAPLAILAAIVAFMAEVKLEVVRLVDEDSVLEPATKRKNRVEVE